MNSDAITDLAARLGETLRRKGILLATAESCTGGWVGQAVTAIAGSSEWYDRGFITYSNQAKQDMLGVSPDTLARCGAVSEATVREMAAGALTRSRAQAALAITGVAGPGGGSPRNPVGTVWFAWAVCVQAHGQGAPHAIEATARHQFAGDRDAIRRQAVQTAMQGMLERAGELPDVPRQPA